MREQEKETADLPTALRSVEKHFHERPAELQIPPLRSESATFSISLVVCGRKARKSICQRTSPGFLRLRSGQALQLRAISRPLCDRSARRFAQDDGFVGVKSIRLATQAHDSSGRDE